MDSSKMIKSTTTSSINVKKEFQPEDLNCQKVFSCEQRREIAPKPPSEAIVNSKKPSISYIGLISMAIQSSPQRKMLLSDIYQWTVNNFPYFKMEDRSWRNSVRHNLSLNECFIKCGRSENGKSHYWTIHPANMHCFSAGDFRRRHARQLVRKCDEDLERLCHASGSIHNQSMECKFQGYVPMSCERVSVKYIKETFGEVVLITRLKQHYKDSALTSDDLHS